jgi:hypothetical protein
MVFLGMSVSEGWRRIVFIVKLRVILLILACHGLLL